MLAKYKADGDFQILHTSIELKSRFTKFLFLRQTANSKGLNPPNSLEGVFCDVFR